MYLLLPFDGTGEVMAASMMDQYASIKEQNPETILFFRMGDFYEMFHEDAEIGSEVLGLTLTSRDKNTDHPTAMAGFPWHALEPNLKTMLATGRKVTVVDQEATLRPGQKILERTVTRVYTPGTLHETNLIGEDRQAMLMSLSFKAGVIGLARIDLSCGIVELDELGGDERWSLLVDEVLAQRPTELLVPKAQAELDEIRGIVDLVPGMTLSAHRLPGGPRAVDTTLTEWLDNADGMELDEAGIGRSALALALDYIKSAHQGALPVISNIETRRDTARMRLDQTTLRNLEVIQTQFGEVKGSLFDTIDCTKTWMGRRRLKSWLLQPLAQTEAIEARQDAVAWLMDGPKALSKVRDELSGMRDMERLATRLAYRQTSPADLIAIATSIERCPSIAVAFEQGDDDVASLIDRTLDSAPLCRPLTEMIRTNLVEAPANSVHDGPIINDGIEDELDRLRSILDEGDHWLESYQVQEKKRTGIASLKVRSSRAIGHYIEVTRTNLDKVPENYRRKQTLSNVERFITTELEEWQVERAGASQRAVDLEQDLLRRLIENCSTHAEALNQLARDLADLDAFASIAHHARRARWVRPTFDESTDLDLRSSRHPVIEMVDEFVPNDIILKGSKHHLTIITGPNMGGKSTYLRQAALCVILAQAGSPVPARSAHIGIVDRIFTRIGAHDELSRGRSTFMVEMLDVAHILKRATEHSLVLLDEIGRGTSTFDGMAIAWAVIEQLATHVKARTLFTTHFHELTALEAEHKGVHNMHVSVDDGGGEPTFLHTVVDGPADQSYGVHVAALAGLPQDVVDRANDLLMHLEEQARTSGGRPSPAKRKKGQRSLWSIPSHSAHPRLSSGARKAIERLKEIDPDRCAPRDALDALFELQALLAEDRATASVQTSQDEGVA